VGDPDFPRYVTDCKRRQNSEGCRPRAKTELFPSDFQCKYSTDLASVCSR
jgi:hypothetical protein